MPIFEYKCQKCGKVFEEIISGNRDDPLPLLPISGNGKIDVCNWWNFNGKIDWFMWFCLRKCIIVCGFWRRVLRRMTDKLKIDNG
jgi:putative FmdB family regulatory protein